MNIRTKEFNLTEKEVRQIHFKLNLRNQRWTILILVAIGILDFILNLLSNQAFSWSFYCFFLVALLIAYPLLVRIKRQNNLNFQTRYAEVDGDFFIMHFQDGSLIKLRYELFRKVIKMDHYYFLYLAPRQVQCLPLAAFYSEADISSFESLLKNKRLL